jgi:hypothetical protein
VPGSGPYCLAPLALESLLPKLLPRAAPLRCRGLPRAGLFQPVGLMKLNPPHQYQDEKNDQDEAEAAGWVESPSAAVRPGWQGADQHDHQDYQDQSRGRHEEVERGLESFRRRRPAVVLPAWGGAADGRRRAVVGSLFDLISGR